MAPLIALVTGFVVLRGLGAIGMSALDGWLPALRGGLAIMFALTASAHFTRRRRADLLLPGNGQDQHRLGWYRSSSCRGSICTR